MDEALINTIKCTPLKKITNPLGDIWHAIKSTEDTYVGFGEAYFSFINKGKIKGWKKHKKATLNLVVPVGEIKFYAYDENSNDRKSCLVNFILSEDNYSRLTIPPGIWLAFKGIKRKNILLNVSDLPHDKNETIAKKLSSFNININD